MILVEGRVLLLFVVVVGKREIVVVVHVYVLEMLLFTRGTCWEAKEARKRSGKS